MRFRRRARLRSHRGVRGPMPGRFGCRLLDVRFVTRGIEGISIYESMAKGRGKGCDERTMPVVGSTWRERVSTAMTWVVLSFHGLPYFRQLAVDTSSQE